MIGFYDQFNLTGSQNHLPSFVAILRGFYQEMLIKKAMIIMKFILINKNDKRFENYYDNENDDDDAAYWIRSEITGKPEPFYPAWKRNVFR